MVDPRYDKLLRNINSSLIMLPMAAGFNGSIALTFLKGATIAFKENGFLGGFSLYVYQFVALMSGMLELRFLNGAMELFEQV